MIYKNALMKIKKSFGRYISLLIIVLVGVGFYAGIQSSAPDFIGIADSYYHDYSLMDFKIVSTMGLSENDAAALEAVKDVCSVTGSYSLDVLEGEKAVRVHAIEESVNRVKLTAGRMPEMGTECVADSKNYQIGDKLNIAGDVEGKLKNTEFTVTGLVESVLYIGSDYGSTTVGDGKLSSFIFISKENFALDAYTEIYLTMEGGKDYTAYSEGYEALSRELNDELIKIKPDRENARYAEIYSEANEKISSNEMKLMDEKADSEKKLTDAKIKLDDNAKKLKDGKEELLKNETELNDTVREKTAEFEKAKVKISDGWKEIDTALSQSGLKKVELSSKVSGLKQAIEGMKAQLAELPADSQQYAQLSAMLTEYSAQYKGLVKLKESVDALTDQETQLKEGIETFHAEIAKARAEIAKGRKELANNEKKLKVGYDEYHENLEKFNTEIGDAEKKLADAKTDLSGMEHPKWIIFDREAAVGYKELYTDIEVVSSIAAVFPIFFIAIAALMTSNTMARMIAEERSELGALASLGYKNKKIISTYLLYVLSATALGAVIGFLLGCTVFPPLIFLNFNYILPPLVVGYNLITLAGIMAVALALMSAVTVIACNRELSQKPAVLMRPLPPKHGQKILLERIGIVWNRLSFTWKVTMRNMFRYKKRALMTIVGVAGCTSLMLVGFGLRDSMDGFVDRQYGDILTYNDMIVLKDEVSGLSGDLKELFTKEQIKKPLLLRQSAMKCEQKDTSLKAYLIVPENTSATFLAYYRLTSKSTGEPISPDSDGVIITEKIAQVFKIGKGDSLMVKDTDNNAYSLTVSEVAENYITNYIYMDSAMYSRIFGKPAMFNAVVSDFSGDEKTLSKNLIDSALVLNTTFTGDIIQKALDGNAKLNSIIILLVVVASLLAIIVLYNLTSINISERKREIATLKVLGFRDSETNAYIYREAVILTLVSIAIGIALGIALHGFVIDVLEGTTRVLLRKIGWFSFLASAALTMVFSLVMQVITYFKLKTVDMVESLKSVE
ncbi:ABC transporter permease [Ruminiclostridium sufflavum]|nr:ABC transporter permease [Ruminiclostridium sufflavum]